MNSPTISAARRMTKDEAAKVEEVASIRSRLAAIGASAEPAGFEADDVLTVCRGVHANLPMSSEQGASLVSISGLPQDKVLDIVAGFGSFLTYRDRSMPKATGVIVSEDADPVGVLPGFTVVNPSRPDGRPVRRVKNQPTERLLRLPEGVARKGQQRRDVTQAYAAIALTDFTALPKLVVAWLARTNPASERPLEWGDVAYVHFSAKTGYLEDLVGVCLPEAEGRTASAKAVEQVNCAARARLYLAALELIEVRRTDAVAAVKHLASAGNLKVEQIHEDRITDFVEDIKASIMTAMWVHQAVMTDLTNMSDKVLEDSKRLPLLLSKLRDFKNRVLAAPEVWIPLYPQQLMESQVLRMAQLAGLDTEDPAALLEEVRHGLDNLGLQAERNRLANEGAAAIRAGLGEVFWEAAGRLAASDPEWRTELDAAMAKASAESSEMVRETVDA